MEERNTRNNWKSLRLYWMRLTDFSPAFTEPVVKAWIEEKGI